MEKCTFSTVTQKYLDSYAGILDTMTGTMNCAKENDSISYNFIVKMIPHHQAAIRISEELLRYTTCIALQNIATEIVVTQTKETEEMRKMLCGCAGYRNDGQSLCGYRRQYGIIVTNMFSRMRSACPDNEGGIAMCRNAMRFSICPQLRAILKEAVKAQVKGIEEMKKLLQCKA